MRKLLFFSLFAFTTISVSLAQKSEPPIVDVNRYAGVSFEIDKRRLDETAEIWRSDPTNRIYLVAYGALTEQKKAKKRLQRSKEYLIKKFAIPSAKVITIYGGTRDEFELLIYLLDLNNENVLMRKDHP